jgi:hypothetical protein
VIFAAGIALTRDGKLVGVSSGQGKQDQQRASMRWSNPQQVCARFVTQF